MKCRKCSIKLILNDNIKEYRLNKKDYICNSCKKKLDSENYQKQKKHRLAKAKENYYKNSENKKQYQKEYYLKNRDKIASERKQHRLDEKEDRNCVVCGTKISKKERKDKIFCSVICASKKNREDNSKNWNERRAEYKRNRYQEDIIFNLKERCRSRTRAFFKWQGRTKNKTTKELLGCDWETLKQHIESQFVDGMSWDNRDLWHIDHIIPLASANTEKEIYALSNYKNLQPLWIEENLKKGSKLI